MEHNAAVVDWEAMSAGAEPRVVSLLAALSKAGAASSSSSGIDVTPRMNGAVASSGRSRAADPSADNGALVIEALSPWLGAARVPTAQVHERMTMGPKHQSLDSACNRTVVGHVWLRAYLHLVVSLGLSRWVSWSAERE